MTEKINFIFIVDVSGSMYGKKIASVNALLSECTAEFGQIDLSDKYDIAFTVATFAEKFRLIQKNAKIEILSNLTIKVEPNEDGFYPVTSFKCLYKGVKDLFVNNKIDDEKNGNNTYVFLLSDAKPVDAKSYDASYEELKECIKFKNATKFFGYVEEKSDKYNDTTVKFVDYKAEHIVGGSEIAHEFNKILMSLVSESKNSGDNSKYDEIFV